jgi:amidase
VLMTELKADLDAYLSTTPAAVTTRTLDQVIAFDDAHAATEEAFFGQELFLAAAKTHGLADAEYLGLRAKSVRLAGREGIDAMLAKAKAAVLVTPTYGPAWLSDPVYGDQYGGPSSSEMPAIAGYPNLTVPMGLVKGLPAGISFISTAYGEATVLNAGYAYEQRAHARVAPRYRATADAGPGMDAAR